MHVHPACAWRHNDHVTEITGGWRDRADRHAPRSAMYPAERAARAGGYYWPADPDTDDFCVFCVPELGEHGWQHDRSCVLGRRRTA